MKTINKCIKDLNASQKATLFYLFMKLATVKNVTKNKLHRKRDYKAAFENKKHQAIITGHLKDRIRTAFIIDNPAGGETFTYGPDYKSMVKALRESISWVERQRDKFNTIKLARIDWGLYYQAKIGKITDKEGRKIDYRLDRYVDYVTAKRDLEELDAAVGAGAYSKFDSRKIKLPHAVRIAVARRRNHLNYMLDSWAEFAGLLDGQAAITNKDSIDVDWSMFKEYGDQEFIYYKDMYI